VAKAALELVPEDDPVLLDQLAEAFESAIVII
jgi:hypothetical protein